MAVVSYSVVEPVARWVDVKAKLEEAGVSPDAMEYIRRLTAPDRARYRIEKVQACAQDWLRSRLEAMEIDRDLVAVLCFLEAGGLYGGGRLEPGAAARRHPAFTDLPSHHAPSGAAWNAAMRYVAGPMTGWSVTEDGGVGVQLVSDRIVPIELVLPKDDLETRWVACGRAVQAAWVQWARGENPAERILADPIELIVAAGRTIG